MAELRLGPKHTALTVGIFAAILHLLWVVFVALGVGQGWIGWVLSLHFLAMSITITAFNFLTAISLVVFTFVMGAVTGLIFAIVFNWVGKKKF